MVSYGLCKFRETMMKKILTFVFLIGLISGCSGEQESSNSADAESIKLTSGGLLHPGQKIIQVLEWLQRE